MTDGDFEQKAAAGAPFSADEAARVLASPDLTSVGHLGEVARKRASGDVITFSRVAEVPGGAFPASAGHAGEVRLTGLVASVDDMDVDKLNELVEANKERRVLAALLKALQAAYNIKKQVPDMPFEGLQVDMKLGLPPHIGVQKPADGAEVKR